MDHRWDEMLQAEHRRRVEEGRYGSRPIESDEDVAHRDQLALARSRVNKSPWEIGAAHWDQRDLYTRNTHTDDSGYGKGPSIHPEVGSYAYHRDVPERVRRPENGPSLYEREAYPWLNYEAMQRKDEHGDERVWDRMKHGASRMARTLIGRHHGTGPKGWRRADDSVREDVCEAFAYDPALDASDIEVTVQNGEVTLAGTVRDRTSKRLAEQLCEQCRGVEDVHNRLVVRKDDDDMAFTAPIAAF